MRVLAIPCTVLAISTWAKMATGRNSRLQYDALFLRDVPVPENDPRIFEPLFLVGIVLMGVVGGRQLPSRSTLESSPNLRGECLSNKKTCCETTETTPSFKLNSFPTLFVVSSLPPGPTLPLHFVTLWPVIPSTRVPPRSHDPPRDLHTNEDHQHPSSDLRYPPAMVENSRGRSPLEQVDDGTLCSWESQGKPRPLGNKTALLGDDSG